MQGDNGQHLVHQLLRKPVGEGKARVLHLHGGFVRSMDRYGTYTAEIVGVCARIVESFEVRSCATYAL